MTPTMERKKLTPADFSGPVPTPPLSRVDPDLRILVVLPRRTPYHERIKREMRHKFGNLVHFAVAGDQMQGYRFDIIFNRLFPQSNQEHMFIDELRRRLQPNGVIVDLT